MRPNLWAWTTACLSSYGPETSWSNRATTWKTMWCIKTIRVQFFWSGTDVVRADEEPAMSTSDTSSSQIASRTANYELNIVLLGTCGGGFFTKPLQGSAFKRQRAHIMNLPIELPLPITTTNSQECVGTLTPIIAMMMSSEYSREGGESAEL